MTIEKTVKVTKIGDEVTHAKRKRKLVSAFEKTQYIKKKKKSTNIEVHFIHWITKREHSFSSQLH